MSDDKREAAWQFATAGADRFSWDLGWDARQPEVDRLQAELDRVAPFLAIHGFNGYTMEAGD